MNKRKFKITRRRKKKEKGVEEIRKLQRRETWRMHARNRLKKTKRWMMKRR